jgi:hypothetical protein
MTQMEELVLAAVKGSITGHVVDLGVEICELNRCTHVEVSAEYEHLDQAEVLQALREFFAPREVQLTNKWSYAGCETCGNGSTYTLEFDVAKEGA